MKGQLIDLGSLAEKINQLELRLVEHIMEGKSKDKDNEVKTNLDGSPVKTRKVKT